MRSRVCLCGLLTLITLTAAWADDAKFNKVLRIGQVAPAFEDLAGVDGKSHSLDDTKDSPVVVLVFMSNRCPVARAYGKRLLALAREVAPKKVQFLAINCGRTQVDSLAAMQKRSRESGFTFPYLKDADLRVGQAYGALATPHLFVLDSKRQIVYMGAFDDNLNASQVMREYVRLAIDAALAGRQPEITESLPRGCPIDFGEKPASDDE